MDGCYRGDAAAPCPFEESRRFSAYATPFLAVSISPRDALPLIDQLKQLAPTATGPEKTALRFAGMKIERHLLQEKRAQQMSDRAAPRGLRGG